MVGADRSAGHIRKCGFAGERRLSRALLHSGWGEHEGAGEFLEIVRPTRVVPTWRWLMIGEPGEEGNVSKVEFRLCAIDTGTELTLIHSALRTEVPARHDDAGWDGALKKLQRRFD